MLGVQRSMFGVFFVLLNSGFFGEGAENCTRGAHSTTLRAGNALPRNSTIPGRAGIPGSGHRGGPGHPKYFGVMNLIATVL